jgi:glycosyltransferase involved in cell wall biosynthesis
MLSKPGNAIVASPVPLVSVVIPVHNGERHVRLAIESVLCQSFQSIEVIVIDDGSTDNTRKVIEDYIDSSAIRYCYQANTGPGAARNTGLKLSRGQYVCFCDHDDSLLPDSVGQRYQLFERHPSLGLVFSDLDKIFQGRADTEDRHETWVLNRYDFPDRIPRSCLKVCENDIIIFNTSILIELILDCFIYMGTAMMPKSVLQTVGGFDEKLMWAEDHDLWLRIARHYDIGFLRRVTYNYVQHSSNLTLNERACFLSGINVRLKHMNSCSTPSLDGKRRFRIYLPAVWRTVPTNRPSASTYRFAIFCSPEGISS